MKELGDGKMGHKDSGTVKHLNKFIYVQNSKKINKKTTKPDAFKLQLWDARYLEIKSQLKMAREELEKSLQSAKYCKIWEKIL